MGDCKGVQLASDEAHNQGTDVLQPQGRSGRYVYMCATPCCAGVLNAITCVCHAVDSVMHILQAKNGVNTCFGTYLLIDDFGH